MTNLPHPMIEKWKAAALAVPTVNENLSMPMHILIGEAIDVARFAQRRWKTARDSEGAILAPNLDLVENHALIRPMDRSRFALDELTSALEYLFTDDVEDGLVSVERARDVYGVVLKEGKRPGTYTVDAEATARHRNS